MLSSKLLAAVLTVFAVVSNAKVDTIPLSPIGNIAAAPLSTGDFTFYYQVSSGAILEDAVTGPFTSGSATTYVYAFQVAPPGQAMLGTPIAASQSETDGSYNDIHLFFFAPGNLLSEYYWTPTIGWQGGSGCTVCIQQSGFFGANGSQTLYAFQTADGTVRVGFISAGSPETLSEAVKVPNGAWSLATLPNASPNATTSSR